MPVLIDNNGTTDPAVNLALEEYCLTNLAPTQSCVLLTVNDPCVVVGKHQCVFAEVDLTAARKTGIRVLRRISGGGAVYHDHGNLNFSFISAFDRSRFGNFAAFLRPVVDTLQSLGLSVSLAGKSDLQINGEKISGNAQYANTRRMLCHGTLLFDADVTRLHTVLAPSAPVIAARGVPSNRSTVTRIRDHRLMDLDMPGFVRAFRDGLMRHMTVTERQPLEPAQWQHVFRLADDKYRCWQWNIGRSPWCRMDCRIPGRRAALVPSVIEVDRGLITRIETAGAAGLGEPWKGRRFEALLQAVDALSQDRI